MFDAGNDLLLFVEKVREMGGSTNVQFSSPKNPNVGGRSLDANEQLENGLQFCDPMEVVALACPQSDEERSALEAKGLLGVKVSMTYELETALLFALAGIRPNGYGAAAHTREREKRYRALSEEVIESLRGRP